MKLALIQLVLLTLASAAVIRCGGARLVLANKALRPPVPAAATVHH